MTLQEIRERLFSLPQEIKEEKDKLDQMNLAGDSEIALKNLKLEKMLLVSQEKGGNDKPKYTNDKQREAAVQQKMEEDPNAEALEQKIREGKRTRNEQMTEVERLENEFRAVRTLANLESSAVSIVADLFSGR